jgi:hypothetical protein
MTRRRLFADQLGPHFLEDLDALVEQERARGGRAP